MDLLFGATDDDLFWCTADVGWVTGHGYVVYGPLANGASTVARKIVAEVGSAHEDH